MPDLFSTVLSEAAFEGISFPCAEGADVEEGHDFAEHTAYLRDGADMEPTGLRAKSGSLTAAFINDIEPGLFPERYQQLLDKLRAKPIGTLTHPSEGIMQAAITAFPRHIDANVRNGVMLRLVWKEHNASASSLLTFSNSVQTDTPQATASQAVIADEAMAAASPSGGYFVTAALVSAQLALLEAGVANYADVTSALRTITDTVDANLGLTIFAGIAGHTAIVALEQLRSTVINLRSRYLPEESRIRRFTVPVTMSDWEVALSVYGNASNAYLIRKGNTLPDPTSIPGGTVLTILPE